MDAVPGNTATAFSNTIEFDPTINTLQNKGQTRRTNFLLFSNKFDFFPKGLKNFSYMKDNFLSICSKQYKEKKKKKNNTRKKIKWRK